LRPKLKEIFGTERPFPMQRTVGAKGQIDYVGKLAPPVRTGEWHGFQLDRVDAKITTDKAGRV
jgi:hypothetical protein